MNKKQEKRKSNTISDENGDSNAQSNGKSKTKPVNKKARTEVDAIQEETQSESESEASEIETPSKVVHLKKNGSIPVVNDYLIIFNCDTDQMYEYLIAHGISLAICEMFQGMSFCHIFTFVLIIILKTFKLK